jgi:hypothetical protein
MIRPAQSACQGLMQHDLRVGKNEQWWQKCIAELKNRFVTT